MKTRAQPQRQFNHSHRLGEISRVNDVKFASHSSIIVDKSHDKPFTFSGVFAAWNKHGSLYHVLSARKVDVQFPRIIVVMGKSIVRRESSTHHRHDGRKVGAEGWVCDVEESKAVLATLVSVVDARESAVDLAECLRLWQIEIVCLRVDDVSQEVCRDGFRAGRFSFAV